ncbi:MULTISPECIES: 1-phosphofructokinase [unclassified Bacillus (in: firmicutes)]|uniref:1-phosphofructokinase n=1 Tax=unclassified Bacillus (in: firmicutes) TaxID=185979 RepID=UPI001BE6E0A0|nr:MULTISPECIES: 1-phosphofructokinase [unclassified Bacillus (in: firmicutes)]MBT2639505.1 1-phosphofructokinase [Bacillus sp. ISL-39]MBT2662511.1 1-phosphofructokinase [Bacillus sp. ISL-45]
MIYTLTLNPSVDYLVEADEIHLGSLNRSSNETKLPGGKGINVSRVLRSLGVDSKATGFIGGFTGRYVEEFLNREGVQTRFVNVEGDTRINIKLKAGTETEINASGPEISTLAIGTLKEQIKQLGLGDYLILAGSIPSSMPDSIYEEIVQICKDTGAEVIVDAEGDLLKNILVHRPFLIKPNHHELGQFFNKEITEADEAIIYGKKLVEAGAKNVIVSLAEKGAVYINENDAYKADVPQGEVKSSVGAGDSMVAGFLAQYLKTGDRKEAFRYSVASGSATAFSIGLCTPEKVEQLLQEVKILNS